jgi:outer membrane protein
LSKSDELNLDAQVASNEVTVVQQENALGVSLLQLKQALLIPASQPFDVEVPTIAPEDLLLDQTRDEIYDVARASMPEVKSAQLKIQGAKYGLRAQQGNLYPRLSIVGGLNTNYSSAQDQQFNPDSTFSFSNRVVGFLNNDLNSPVYSLQPNGTFTDYGFVDQYQDNVYKTLGFQISIPIFNNFSVRANIKRARIQSLMAEINAVEVDQTLRQNVETAYNNALAASKSFNAFLRQVEAREEAFRMMEKRFDAGSANSFEYQVSQNELFRSRSDLSRAKYDFIFRKKVLDFYQGKPLEY